MPPSPVCKPTPVPLEDTAEDVMRLALDALDKSKGVKPAPPKPKKSRRRGNKTPQRDFRLPLMKVVLELGGWAEVKDIRGKLLPVMKSRLSKDDFEPVSTGEERWWNATCWERSELVKEGLFRDDSPRGAWELSDEGIKQLRASLGTYMTPVLRHPT